MTNKSSPFRDALRRFLAEAPALRGELSAPAISDEELLLRGAMRRTISKLASILDEAALEATTPADAVVLHETSLVAARLAACKPRPESPH